LRILVLGGDGYLGWPTSMHLAGKGHQVCVADNYLRRKLSKETHSDPLFKVPDLKERASVYFKLSGNKIKVNIGDCADYHFLVKLIKNFKPETIIHYAEQPSAPYSMRDYDSAHLTFKNNLDTTFNLIWAVKELVPKCHLIKLGTMGEYGTPNIDIEEGWLDIKHNGRNDTFLYPRQAGSLYHTTKVLDTDLLWFYVRTSNLCVTDLMQGPVYGLSTKEADLNVKLSPFFNYDDIFGTVVNRFVTQAVAGIPLTIYGKGEQVRGYINIKDTLQCIELAVDNQPKLGELRVLNQFTEKFSVNEIASIVKNAAVEMGLDVKVESITNPRQEKEEHYYNPKHSGLVGLGLKPNFLTKDVIKEMIKAIIPFKKDIDIKKIMPRVNWEN
jgi:UDP-sulfoquinovose synthase